MAAPRSAPTPVIDTTRAYASPATVPAPWQPGRPGELTGFQPTGGGLGYQGPDQGFALKIANGFADRLRLQPGEHAADAIRGCLGVALRRASMFSRAPVVHDLTVAFTVWGYLADNPPAELVQLRSGLFAGLGHGHHYTEARAIADSVPEATLRMTPAQVGAAFPARWRELLGR
ncbi:MAG TPA: hypothetical protein PLV13_11310 [Ilumatobacteraceae bacterium]|nr:hypothetical protein [Ilumatobacteraceae bacterium]